MSTVEVEFDFGTGSGHITLLATSGVDKPTAGANGMAWTEDGDADITLAA